MNSEYVSHPPAPTYDFRRDLWRGVGLILALHFLQVPFALYSKGVTLLFMWLSQAVYVGPAIIVALIKQRYGLTVGIIIAAALTFLLSVGICGALTVMGIGTSY